jgi:hypothetical protein
VAEAPRLSTNVTHTGAVITRIFSPAMSAGSATGTHVVGEVAHAVVGHAEHPDAGGRHHVLGHCLAELAVHNRPRHRLVVENVGQGECRERLVDRGRSDRRGSTAIWIDAELERLP